MILGNRTEAEIDYEKEKFAWFRLLSLEGLNSEKVQWIRVKAQSKGLKVSDIFVLSKGEIPQIFDEFGEELIQGLKAEDLASVEDKFHSLVESGVEPIYPGHRLYPLNLLKFYLFEAPAMIFAKGALELLQANSIAIIGSREASEEALTVAAEIAGKAAENGWNVISGYARGIDTWAHCGAISSDGTTTMVLPIGIEKFKLRKELAELPWENNSLILSQFQPDEHWKDTNGLARNKTIIGLSRAVIVVQAEYKGGTLYSGNRALKNGVPLFVASGKILREYPAGNDILLQKGARPFESLEELFSALTCLNKIENNH